jgi:hypothetical protein
MMPGGPLAHSRICWIEYLEDPNHDGWEIDLNSQMLCLNWLVRMTMRFGGGLSPDTVMVRETL